MISLSLSLQKTPARAGINRKLVYGATTGETFYACTRHLNAHITNATTPAESGVVVLYATQSQLGLRARGARRQVVAQAPDLLGARAGDGDGRTEAEAAANAGCIIFRSGSQLCRVARSKSIEVRHALS